jgi:hypothetical protein
VAGDGIWASIVVGVNREPVETETAPGGRDCDREVEFGKKFDGKGCEATMIRSTIASTPKQVNVRLSDGTGVSEFRTTEENRAAGCDNFCYF